MPYGTIYMLPTPIGDRPVYDVLPEYNRAVMARLDYFIVENERTARRFLSRAGIGKPIDGLRIAELNEHTTPEQVAELLAPVLGGADAGVLVARLRTGVAVNAVEKERGFARTVDDACGQNHRLVAEGAVDVILSPAHDTASLDRN